MSPPLPFQTKPQRQAVIFMCIRASGKFTFFKEETKEG